MHFASIAITFLAAAFAPAIANPIAPRQAAISTTCLDASQKIAFYDENVAQLAICGGIAGKITKCGGAPTSTIGQSGTAKFSLKPLTAGATLNISKGRWERCIKAARKTCQNGSLKATCPGGASSGDTEFTLANP
ncbi:hypothetical protein Micbo1qcDRAFT_153462 [Microdochium bolleyi]|uniref:Uncharacterized protein n=1 Tax=Microdochium bolleyi TaxID=196109 RepID=A0A136IM07_9PEZI|nr:hypothetical protein Micbo1qcDRAFT_153462 [Microdochium bolleyi]